MLSFLFIKNNPEKLAETYYESSDKETRQKIITRLMELNADLYIEQIFIKSPKEDLFEYLFKKYDNSAQKMFDYFLISIPDIKQKIVYQLISLKADTFIKKLINTEYENMAVEYLIARYANEVSQLIALLKTVTAENKKNIIKYIYKCIASLSAFAAASIIASLIVGWG